MLAHKLSRKEMLAQKRKAAYQGELLRTFAALRENDRQFQQATDQYFIAQLIFERASLFCHCRTILTELRRDLPPKKLPEQEEPNGGEECPSP